MTSDSPTAAACFATRLKTTVVATYVTMFVFFVVVLCQRRLAGSLNLPLGSCGLAGIALFVLASCVIVRDGLREVCQTCAERYRICRWLPVTLAVLVGLAVSLPGSPQLGLLALWLAIGTVLGSEVNLARQPPTQPLPITAEPTFKNISASLSDSEEADSLDDGADETIIQQLTRRREASGAESIHGQLRANFTVGERTTYLHVAFCPPFEQLPECSAEPVDGAAARVKISQILPQGARIEVKLEQVSAEPASVLLEFSAWTASETAE